MAALVKRGKYWYVILSLPSDNPDSKRPYKTVWKNTHKETKQEAKLVKAQLELDKQKGLIQPTTSKISFSVFIKEQYLPWSKANKSPRAFLSNVYSCKSLLGFFSGYRLERITSYLVEQFKMARKEKVGERTINIEVGCLKQMFRLAKEWGFVADDPTINIKKYKEPKKIPRFLSVEEIKLLLKKASPSMRMYLLIGLGTGMRNEEILNLRLDNIDYERGIIYVRSRPSDGFFVKNRRDRAIPIISDYLLDQLKWFSRHWVDNKTLTVKKRTENQGEYFFCDENGQRIKRVQKAFNNLVKKAELTRVTPHTLRHTFGSQLAMNGVDIRTIQDVMGHSSIKTTEIYLHVSSQHKQEKLREIQYSKIFKLDDNYA